MVMPEVKKCLKKTFVNFSNHPSSRWSKEQIAEALRYSRIVDVPFPEVDPKLDAGEVSRLAGEYAGTILEFGPAAVMCQGEMTLCFKVVEILKSKGVLVLAACSSKETTEDVVDAKKSIFRFVRFREY